MRKKKLWLRTKIYPILWSGIILISIYLLIRFAALSFSDDMGQANLSFKDVALSNLCSKVMESGSSLIRYTAKEEEGIYAFPISMVANEFNLQKFTKNNSFLTAKAKEYSSSLTQNYNFGVTNVGETEKTEDLKKEHNSIGFHDIARGFLSKEYILSNGTLFGSYDASNSSLELAEDVIGNGNAGSEQLQIGYLEGKVYYEETEDEAFSENQSSTIETVKIDNRIEYTMEQMKDINFLVRNFYIVDPSTKVTEKLFDGEKLLGKDMTLKQESDTPQILIYHTHSQEAYIDSRKDKIADTVVGVGSYLTEILKEKYGYNVIHDNTCYDDVNRNVAYNKAKDGISKILDENPTIEVVIDIHRDGTEKRSTIIAGEETAQIMLFNGLSRDQNGPITYLDNPFMQDNLAFSLQLQLKSLDLYPGLFYKNYLKCYRYNMHVRKKSILMELGTYKNTLQSAKNAMEPFAQILDEVLQGK